VDVCRVIVVRRKITVSVKTGIKVLHLDMSADKDITATRSCKSETYIYVAQQVVADCIIGRCLAPCASRYHPADLYKVPGKLTPALTRIILKM
jgi:hypothetical protein